MPDRPSLGISKRKQPRQARSSDLVAAVLEAATQVLGEVGAERFTTARVAERAGVSIGSLYQYFPNKAAILFQLQSDEWRDTTALLAGILGAIAVVRLNRQEARNALSRALMRELIAAADALRPRTDIQAVVLSGGPDFFTAGADLADTERNPPDATLLERRETIRFRAAGGGYEVEIPGIFKARTEPMKGEADQQLVVDNVPFYEGKRWLLGRSPVHTYQDPQEPAWNWTLPNRNGAWTYFSWLPVDHGP